MAEAEVGGPVGGGIERGMGYRFFSEAARFSLAKGCKNQLPSKPGPMGELWLGITSINYLPKPQ